MARITVEDCLSKVTSRFQLVLQAADLARKFVRGVADPSVPWENDKATVVALREIAAESYSSNQKAEIETESQDL